MKLIRFCVINSINLSNFFFFKFWEITLAIVDNKMDSIKLYKHCIAEGNLQFNKFIKTFLTPIFIFNIFFGFCVCRELYEFIFTFVVLIPFVMNVVMTYSKNFCSTLFPFQWIYQPFILCKIIQLVWAFHNWSFQCAVEAIFIKLNGF